jgi:hypothetical protein
MDHLGGWLQQPTKVNQMEITLPIATWALPQILQVLTRLRLMMEAVTTNLQTTTAKPFQSI